MPVYEVEDARTGRKFELEGDSPPTEAELIEIFGEVREQGTTLEGIGEVAGTMASGLAGEIAGGLGGLLTLDPDAVEQVRDKLTFVPETETGREMLAEFGEIMQPINEGLKGAEDFFGGRGAELLSPFGEQAEAVGFALGSSFPTAMGVLTGARTLPRDVPDLNPDTVLDAAQSVQGRTDQVAERADIDPEVIAAADRVGIERPAAAGARNTSFVEATQALKSQPGSHVLAEEIRAIEQLGQKSGQLIRDLDGTTDRSLFDAQLSEEVQGTIAQLEETSQRLFDQVNRAIPGRTKVNPGDARNFIEDRLEDLGGDATLLSRSEQELRRLLKTPQVTYFALDRLRRNVGDGFSKRRVRLSMMMKPR